MKIVVVGYSLSSGMLVAPMMLLATNQRDLQALQHSMLLSLVSF
jgi:hypothetical protein